MLPASTSIDATIIMAASSSACFLKATRPALTLAV